jgi:N-acetylneuraminate synthase
MNVEQKNTNCKIIAEVGLAHEGSLGLAFKFIEAAKRSGADIVKFQLHIPEFESSISEKFRIEFSPQDKTRWEYWNRTAFTLSEWQLIVNKCKAESIDFCVSVFCVRAIEMMVEIGVKNLKLGSGDLNNLELQDSLMNWNGNLFISTGMSTYSEIDQAINAFKFQLELGTLTVFQCTSKYPTPMDQVGLNVMKEIKNKWKVRIGLSDHSEGIDSSIAAICHGAEAIEKHVVFSLDMFGPDVTSSINFEELKTLVKFRDNYNYLMKAIDKDSQALQLANERQIFGRSLGFNRAFRSGEIVRVEDFCLRKPAGGLNWNDRHLFVGKKLNRDVNLGELIHLEYVDE